MSTSTSFDAIIVGARVAGTATAFALARNGWRVALIERKERPLGGTLSLPITQPRGLARFRELGLLPAIEAIMPHLKPIRSYYLGMAGGITIAGNCPAYAGFDYGVILRREVLDEALLEYATQAFPQAITVFDATNVDKLLTDPTTGQVTGVAIQSTRHHVTREDLYAPLVIGADGRYSTVARQVSATAYHVRHSATTLFYNYCQGIDMQGLADTTFQAVGDNRLVVFSEIGDGLQTVSAWFPTAQFAAFRQAPRDEITATWRRSPELAARMANLQFVGKTMGLSPATADGYFRPTGGPGWALVGDARHYKDPASGQGLHDALYSVQQLLAAITLTTEGSPLTPTVAARRWPKRIDAIQQHADRELMPMYRFTYTFAEGLTRPPTRLEHALLQTIASDPAATRSFLGIMTGATAIGAFNRASLGYIARGLLARRQQPPPPAM